MNQAVKERLDLCLVNFSGYETYSEIADILLTTMRNTCGDEQNEVLAYFLANCGLEIIGNGLVRRKPPKGRPLSNEVFCEIQGRLYHSISNLVNQITKANETVICVARRINVYLATLSTFDEQVVALSIILQIENFVPYAQTPERFNESGSINLSDIGSRPKIRETIVILERMFRDFRDDIDTFTTAHYCQIVLERHSDPKEISFVLARMFDLFCKMMNTRLAKQTINEAPAAGGQISSFRPKPISLHEILEQIGRGKKRESGPN